MAPRLEPVTSDTAVPASTQVVVIGGGIIGTSTALFLAEKGVPTVLCEKGHIAGEQSSRNWGWVRKMGRDPREIPLIIESLRIWERLGTMVEGETGFRRSGILYLCDGDEAIAKREAWLEYARPYQLDSHFISGTQLADLLPGASRQWKAALYTPSDGRAEPQMAAPAIARAVQRRGGTVLTHCAVRGIETEGGRVAAVVTEKGRIRCQSVVLAGGAWSSLFLRNLGLRLPQLKVLASVQRTAPFEGPGPNTWGGDFAFRKRLDGGYTIAHGGLNMVDLVPDSFRFAMDFLPVLRLNWHDLRFRVGRRFLTEAQLPSRWALDQVSPFETVRTLDPEPVLGHVEQARSGLIAAFPQFRDVPIVERWAGLIDAMPDAVPTISPVDSLPGLVVATGFSGHGFGIGPGAGRLVADLVTGDSPIVDPKDFRFSRFSDGSRPRPTTGV
ncbi:MAG: FAD-binding oxidoreductase [Dongiaceae bacterium]